MDHEVLDDSVEGCVGVPSALDTLGRNNLEVFGGPGYQFTEQTNHNPAHRLAAYRHVKVHQVRYLVLFRLQRIIYSISEYIEPTLVYVYFCAESIKPTRQLL